MDQQSTNISSFKVGFLTSGGDSPGMNAAIRAVVRMVIHGGGRPFAIREGFRGLCMHGFCGGSTTSDNDNDNNFKKDKFLEIVKGKNEYIEEMQWNDVVNIADEGGTVIKSSRCPEFCLKRWRLRATAVLCSFGIDRLIVIGGDGSLTGADMLRGEWSEHLVELGHAPSKGELHLIGIAGSIDNDMVGTEATIGSDSSLHRILDAIDCIHSTASSHQRAFIIEVMGRHCGWLALKAAICCAADWLLIPEAPPGPRWEEEMLSMLHANRKNGRSVSIVIVSEGAVDLCNRRITTEHVKEILCSEFQGIKLDARVSCLGHIQRGGSPSAYDRYLATLQGIKAAQLALASGNPLHKGALVSLEENEITSVPLMECVEKTKLVQKRMSELRFEEALLLRDKDFLTNLSMWQLMHHQIRSRMKIRGIMQDGGVPTTNAVSIEHDKLYKEPPGDGPRKRIGIMTVGAPCGGMNAAILACKFYGQCRSIDVIGISNGFEGLVEEEWSPLSELSLASFSKGGTILGTNRALPSVVGLQSVKALLEKHFDALVIIGGFEAYLSVIELKGLMPIILLPATISNNVPGTEYSIGSDTALNVIMKSCEYVRQSASSSRKRVFIVDVQGGHCGYLATVSAFVSCATRAMTGEQGVSLDDLKRDALHFKERFSSDSLGGRIIIRNELSSPVYTAEITSKILEQEGQGKFDSRWIVLGHLQQGGSPSPLDRVRAVRMSLLAMSYLEQLLCPSDKGVERTFQRLSEGFSGIDDIVEALHTPKLLSLLPVNNECAVMGIKGSRIEIRHIDTLRDETDFQNRRPTERCWDELGRFTRILSKYES